MSVALVGLTRPRSMRLDLGLREPQTSYVIVSRRPTAFP